MTEKETNQHCADGHLVGDFVPPAKKHSEVKKRCKNRLPPYVAKGGARS